MKKRQKLHTWLARGDDELAEEATPDQVFHDTLYIFKERRLFLGQPVVDCNYRGAKVRHNEHTFVVVMNTKPRGI